MAPFYQKPENALKRADELVAVSQHSSALSLLHEIIISKRARSTPLATLEPIVLKFLELCVQLSKGKIAREGLFAYKNIAQNLNIATIELVIKKFLEYAKNSLEAAQKKANQINLVLIDDLEAAETPESIMMNTVSPEESKDRTDRQVVTPWLRFLWEAYRNALDTLRNNSRLEGLYQIVANEAFGFCLKYDRKTEFRRLCETLRQHLISAAKYSYQTFSIDLNDPETLQRHLDIRFAQLNAAADMKLWQEGFRSVEDIYNLIYLSKKTPKPYMMANYYDKLSRILLKGGNYLFHAASFQKNLEISRLNPNLTEEDHQRNASQFLVSVLAIPIIKNQNIEEEKSKTGRITTLLDAEVQSSVPTRATLLQKAKSLFHLVSPQVKKLYELLEVQFHPLSICQKVAPIIKSFSENEQLRRYVKPLHQVILTRLLQQLSQVYSSIKISGVVKLAAFPAPYDYDARTIETFVVNGCRTGEFSIRIDHKTQSLIFEPTSSLAPSADKEHSSYQSYARLHSLPADRMRAHLNMLTARLQAAVELAKPEIKAEREEARVAALRLAAENISADRDQVYYRRLLIQRKLEKKQEELAEQERLRQQKLVDLQLAEQVRLAEQEKVQAQERLLEQRKEIERAEAQKLAEKIANELREKNVKIKDDEIMDTDKLIELQVQQLEKERRELAQKTKALNKRIDHVERAFRKEEVKHLEEDYKQQQMEEAEAYKNKIESIIQAAKTKHDHNMVRKKQVAKMMDDYRAYRSVLEKEREEHYAVLKKEADSKLKEEKEKRIKQHEKEKADELERAEEARIAAEKKKAADKAREEEKLLKAEQDAINQQKLKEQEDIQRKKIAEIEKKLEAPSPAPSVYRPPIVGGKPSWRDRVAAKEAAGGGAVPPVSRTPSENPSLARTASSESSSGAAWRRTTPVSSTAFGGNNGTLNGDKPSAFSSIKKESGNNPASSTGPPRIGSGKWASKRDQQ